jgi:putative N6-adenine-specific DNA methylase
MKITIKTLQNLEEILAGELKELGATNIEIARRAVHFTGNKEQLYQANLHLRTALRVLVPIAEFPIRQADDIYSQAMKTDWTKFLNLEQTFAIDPNVHSEFIRHSNYASVKLKDAIADCFTKKFSKRPDVNPDRPDVLFNLHVDNHRVTVSLDSSGESLNRRGYRNRGAMAPLNEVLAAGMILSTGWKGDTDFYDPMCGSGTLAIEASMIAQNLPAQFLRNDFGFMHWNDFDKNLWMEVKKAAQEKIVPSKCNVYASDADPRQLKVAEENIENAGFESEINLQLSDIIELRPKGEAGIMVINPPYGERIEDENLDLLYKSIGDTLKHQWPGFTAWIISSNDEAMKRIGLKPSRKIPLINGTLNCKFQRFDLFKGTRKDLLSAKFGS